MITDTMTEIVKSNWVDVCSLEDVPVGAGTCVMVGNRQIALFRIGKDQVRALQNICPHKAAAVMHQGIVGDHAGEPKITCPLHKRAYSLVDGRNLTGEGGKLRTFAVRVVDDRVQVEA
jgi:nitrite reductase (NADH) small subunit